MLLQPFNDLAISAESRKLYAYPQAFELTAAKPKDSMEFNTLSKFAGQRRCFQFRLLDLKGAPTIGTYRMDKGESNLPAQASGREKDSVTFT